MWYNYLIDIEYKGDNIMYPILSKHKWLSVMINDE